MSINKSLLNDEQLIFYQDAIIKKQIPGDVFTGVDTQAITFGDFIEGSLYVSEYDTIRYTEDFIYDIPIRTVKQLGPIPNTTNYNCIYFTEGSYYYNKGIFDIPIRIKIGDNELIFTVMVNCDNHQPVNISVPARNDSKTYGIYIGKKASINYDISGFCLTLSSVNTATICVLPASGIVTEKVIAMDQSEWILI